MCARHGTAKQTTEFIGKEIGPNLDRSMRTKSRSLDSAPDRCQVDSLAKLMAEVRANCWRFTLDGCDAPDTRLWSALLDSGDHRRIVTAERTHYLDWQDKSLRGGTRWASADKRGVADAIRRTWIAPAQP